MSKMSNFLTVTPYQRVYSAGEHRWLPMAMLLLNPRYIVSITVMSEKFSQIRMRDGSQYIVPTSQLGNENGTLTA